MDMGWEFDWLYALQRMHTPILDRGMIVLSTLGNAGILWIVLGICLCITKKYRRCGVQMLAAIVITFVIGNLILKNLVCRERPCWIDPNVVLLIPRPGDYSFPSGHSMNGFTAAVTLFLYDRRFGIPALVLAALIAFSRLYHFVHFPTDVFAGVFIGTLVAWMIHVLFQRITIKKRKVHDN